MSLNSFLAFRMPFLGPYKRFFGALIDSLLPVRSYSQHGEDTYIWNLFSAYSLLDGIYIDVGANHPTSISNTYLFYRRGLRGLIIEPNPELARLHRIFRGEDTILPIGIDNKRGVFALNISKTPVLSSFKSQAEHLFWKKEYVPVLKLDDIAELFTSKRISLLSIDTEGLNLEVLKGASQTLEKTILLCIEVDNEDDDASITSYLLDHQFVMIKHFGCNRIYANTALINIHII